MTQKTVIRPAGTAPAVGPYHHAVRIGDLLFCSGQIPVSPKDPNAAFPADIRAQTEQVIRNIEAILSDQGLTLHAVVKATVFMINLGDFGAMNEVYSRSFGPEYPARSTVQVAALPRGAAVEIEVIAHY
jgi:2-iminobutanoate/2-iminopropanoate deaminase